MQISSMSGNINFRKIFKIIYFSKTSLGVKPPLKISMVSHNTIIWKMDVLMGGLTLAPRYKMQL